MVEANGDFLEILRERYAIEAGGLNSEDFFYCRRFRCWMAKRRCVERQEEKGTITKMVEVNGDMIPCPWSGGEGEEWMFPECRRCEQGREIRAEMGLEPLPVEEVFVKERKDFRQEGWGKRRSEVVDRLFEQTAKRWGFDTVGDMLRTLYECGFTVRAIADVIGCNYETVRKRLLRHGVEMRPSGPMRRRKNLEKCIEDVLEQIKKKEEV